MTTHPFTAWLFFLKFLMQQKYFFKKCTRWHNRRKYNRYIFFLLKYVSHKTSNSFVLNGFVH